VSDGFQQSLFGFNKAIAGVAVVIDAVLSFEFLDMPQRGLGVRTGDAIAQRFAGVEKDFFEATGETHPLVFGEIAEESGEPFLDANGQIDPLDWDRIADSINVMAETEFVAVKIANPVVAEAVRLVLGRFKDFNPAGPMKFVELVGIAHDEINGTAFGTGRTVLQEDLDFVEIQAGEGRRFALKETELKAELFRVEIGSSSDIGHREAWVVTFAVNVRCGRSAHGAYFNESYASC
jgi:hypothetical protein